MANRLLATCIGLLSLSFLSAGCSSGQGEEPERGQPLGGERLDGREPDLILSSEECQEPQPGSSPLRRLSHLEYRNSLIALGYDAERVGSVTSLLSHEPESLGFRNSASALTVTSLLAQQYRDIAHELSADFSYACSEELAGAEPDVERACAIEMIETVGARLYRRPLDVDEQRAYLLVYSSAREQEEHEAAVARIIRTMLQSAHFLYRVEIPDADEVTPVIDHEMASRLSFALWHSSPDQELRRAASQGELRSVEQIVAQTYRMLDDQRATALLDFFNQWLDLDELEGAQRDPQVYAGLSSQWNKLLSDEAHSFILHLLRTPGASFSDLLTANYTYANAELAEHYGLPEVQGDAFLQVEAPGRSGILTQGMLAAQDGAKGSSIVRRGLKIRTDFLCQLVPAPPDNVQLTLEEVGAELTQSEWLRVHTERAGCGGCHQLMNPIGRVFEGFDAVGRAREVDEFGSQLQTQGEMEKSGDMDGPLDNVDDLAHRLAQGSESQQCYMIQNLRYFLGREVGQADLCTQAQVFARFQKSGMGLLDLILGIVQSDAFLYKARRQDGQTSVEGESQ